MTIAGLQHLNYLAECPTFDTRFNCSEDQIRVRREVQEYLTAARFNSEPWVHELTDDIHTAFGAGDLSGSSLHAMVRSTAITHECTYI
jgi:hypothetical protein